MTERLKVAVVGVGSLGQHHARIYSQLESVELAGVYDVNTERAARIARKCKTGVLENLEDVAARVDAASVCVPTDRHCEVASLLMEQGTHLLVEKPISSSTTDAEAMVKMAEEKGLILQVGHIERFNPVMKSLEELLDGPGFIEAVRLAPFPPSRGGQSPRGTEVSVVLDLMIHDLEIILHLVRSELTDLHAVGVSVLSPTEDIANARLCFANGCVANVSASRISREKVRKIRVFQKNAYVSLDYQKQSGHMYRKTPDGIVREKVPVEKRDPLENELTAFAECVMTRAEPVVTGKHASDALRLAVRICHHIREGGS